MVTLSEWVEATIGYRPKDPKLFERALTHSSVGSDNYERLEYLGDRVVGLAVAARLYELFPDEPEGKLSRRLNVLVARTTCAEIAREIGIQDRLRLGKQARDDGAQTSDNVLGDTIEAMIGAVFLEAGFAAAEKVVRRLWDARVDTSERAPLHPKSALQEWAAANGKPDPVYTLAGRSGADHAPVFSVRVKIEGAGEAQGEGTSKQEAETAAAGALLARIR